MSFADKIDAFLENSFPNHDTAIYRDLSLNLKKVMDDSPLEPIERWMNVGAIARSLHWKELESFAAVEMKELGHGDDEIRECFDAAAIMGMNNTYYKFRGYLPEAVAGDYQRAGLRMNSLMKPVNGKARFEAMAFAVSVVNGCPTCIGSHEKSLTDLEVSKDKIHDLARLAAVLKGLSCLH